MFEPMDTINKNDSWVISEMQPTTEEIHFRYYPDDNETSLWMYAMITVGTAFVIFVVLTIYLMCHSTVRQVAEEDVKYRTVATRAAYRDYQRPE